MNNSDADCPILLMHPCLMIEADNEGFKWQCVAHCYLF